MTLRSTLGVAALACGLLPCLLPAAARGIEVHPSEQQQPATDAPPADGPAWDDGAGRDEEADAAALAARSAAAEEALRAREGAGRDYRYLPSTPLLRDAVKRTREEARGRDQGQATDQEAPESERRVPTTAAPPGARNGLALFIAVVVLGVVVAGVAAHRRGWPG